MFVDVLCLSKHNVPNILVAECNTWLFSFELVERGWREVGMGGGEEEVQ